MATILVSSSAVAAVYELLLLCPLSLYRHKIGISMGPL